MRVRSIGFVVAIVCVMLNGWVAAQTPASGVGLFNAPPVFCSDSRLESDRKLAACLHALADYLSTTPDERVQLDQLTKGGVSPEWKCADGRNLNLTYSVPIVVGGETQAGIPSPAVPGTTPMTKGTRVGVTPALQPQPNVRQLTTICGLVVMQTPDGRYHGKSVDIIAAATGAPMSPARMRYGGTIGKEMMISFDEAMRLVKMRKSDVDRMGLEISFGDKYSNKDGGSAGTAFAVLLLSAMGEFEVSDKVALTGDITIDGKVRPVGEVAAKVHGAALDKIEYACVPSECVSQMEDAIVSDGPSVLWETQILSMTTLDDAIALVRKDKDEKLAQAMSLFAELRARYATSPVETLKDGEPATKLQQVILLAPNHVSARYLQQLASGKGPTCLSVPASVQQAILAVGPVRESLFSNRQPLRLSPNDAAASVTVRKNLAKAKTLAHPSTHSLYAALDGWCVACSRLSMATNARMRMVMEQKLMANREAVYQAVMNLVSDREVIDKLMHP